MTALILPILYDRINEMELEDGESEFPLVPVVVVNEDYILQGYTQRELYLGKPLGWWKTPLASPYGMVFVELHTRLPADVSFGYLVNTLFSRDWLLTERPEMKSEIPDDLAWVTNVSIYILNNKTEEIRNSRFFFAIALNNQYELLDWSMVNRDTDENNMVDTSYLPERSILDVVAGGMALVGSVLYHLTDPDWLLLAQQDHEDGSIYIELEPKKEIVNHAPPN